MVAGGGAEEALPGFGYRVSARDGLRRRLETSRSTDDGIEVSTISSAYTDANRPAKLAKHDPPPPPPPPPPPQVRHNDRLLRQRKEGVSDNKNGKKKKEKRPKRERERERETNNKREEPVGTASGGGQSRSIRSPRMGSRNPITHTHTHTHTHTDTHRLVAAKMVATARIIGRVRIARTAPKKSHFCPLHSCGH